MRIISGSHKGRRFQVGTKFTARPTTDFAKETLFNILQNMYDFEDLVVLDLFGGTGSISYEFASRGVKSVLTIEKNSKHHEYINKNRDSLGFNKVMQTIKADVFKYLPKLKQSFDIIFADPPFNLDTVSLIPALVLETSLLKENGVFILEHSSAHDFSKNPHFERLIKRGSVLFSIFSHKNN